MSHAQEHRLVVMVLVVLVLARSAVFLFWEQAFFDSD
jgi:hypothetical protein